ncbi:hypothetical protein JXO59_14480, partial [candidate division KSB1 bacterium]|nr:hypothetical protein [candidate division KSB1 bacterium]
MKSNPFRRLISQLALVIVFSAFVTPMPHLFAQTRQVEQAMFGPLLERFEEAKEDQVPFYASQNYNRAFQLYQSALLDFKKGEKLAKIRGQIKQANESLDLAFEATRVSRVAMEKLVTTRSRFQKLAMGQIAPDEVTSAERFFFEAMHKAEEGDIRSAREKSEKANEQYRKATLKWLKDGFIKQNETKVKDLRDQLSQETYRQTLDELQNIRDYVDHAEDVEFDPFDMRDTIMTRVNDAISALYPPFYRNLPDTLLIGDFVLLVDQYIDKGVWAFKKQQATGLSGAAWTNFDCILYLESIITVTGFQVVAQVVDPVKQIGIEDAKIVKPDVHIGDTVDLQLYLDDKTDQNILAARDEYIKTAKTFTPEGQVLVHFDSLTIVSVSGRPNLGRVTDGIAAYPTKVVYPKSLSLSVDNFTAYIDSLLLTADGASADITLKFPPNIASDSTCKPAKLPLGMTTITPKCEFYAETAMPSYGPWIMGEMGMAVSGTDSIIADFSSTTSPLSKNASWMGVVLMQ